MEVFQAKNGERRTRPSGREHYGDRNLEHPGDIIVTANRQGVEPAGGGAGCRMNQGRRIEEGETDVRVLYSGSRLLPSSAGEVFGPVVSL
jgi:hypothetical protein